MPGWCKINFVKSLLLYVILLIVFNTSNGCEKQGESPLDPQLPIQVPLEGNCWILKNTPGLTQQVSDYKSSDWKESNQVLRTFFRVSDSGEIGIGIKVRVPEGKSLIKAIFNGESKETEVSGNTFTEVFIGNFAVPASGYFHLDISGISKQGNQYAEISNILLGGPATGNGVNFSDKEYFYWGRRGPSVHLSYKVPDEASSVKWFYNEVTVPEGNDVTGSYFMANGFSEGYFGFQVNSDTERRILFSVWSPYKTDNPASIPPEYRVLLLRKGNETVIREFGNEGSGGQSFLRYNWKAGNTYRFLLKTEPAEGEANKTDYSAWFYAPEVGHWTLIASWRRPFTHTWAKGLHSFLENFLTETGPMMRQAYYGNQWVCDSDNRWHELTRARFTADATARNNARLDYAGGLTEDLYRFFLKNCGFFNETTTVDTWFTRKVFGIPPDVDFTTLP
jgi:hypothetical protein